MRSGFLASIEKPSNSTTRWFSRSAEDAVLQPLREQAKTGAIPEDQFDPARTLGPEHVDRARERIGHHGLAHQCCQSLGALAEVDRLGRYQSPGPRPSGRSPVRLQRLNDCRYRVCVFVTPLSTTTGSGEDFQSTDRLRDSPTHRVHSKPNGQNQTEDSQIRTW